jgi:hypothetical protein
LPISLLVYQQNVKRSSLRKGKLAWCWWLTPVILGTQEEEIRRIVV